MNAKGVYTAEEAAVLEMLGPFSEELPWIRLARGNVSPDAKIYTARDVEAFMAIAVAADRAQRHKSDNAGDSPPSQENRRDE